jgi:chromosome segregation ATPase
MSDGPHRAEVQPQIDEIKQRLGTLESKVESESSLRAMMDLDQAKLTARFDAQDRLLRALGVTQSDHTRRLTRLEAGVRLLDARVTEGQAHLAEGLTHLHDRQTRLEAGQTRLEAGQSRMETGQSRMEDSLQSVLTLLQSGSGR